MQEGSWSQAFAELLQSAWAAMVRLWTQLVVQVGATVGVFLLLALPLLLVILLLWVLDATGWRASSGFYTIGQWQAPQAPQARPALPPLKARIAPLPRR